MATPFDNALAMLQQQQMQSPSVLGAMALQQQRQGGVERTLDAYQQHASQPLAAFLARQQRDLGFEQQPQQQGGAGIDQERLRELVQRAYQSGQQGAQQPAQQPSGGLGELLALHRAPREPDTAAPAKRAESDGRKPVQPARRLPAVKLSREAVSPLVVSR